MQKVVIIGAGGFAREVLDVFDAANQDKPAFEVLGYIVDLKYGTPGTIINNLPILGGYDWLSGHAKKVSVICGVGPPHQRFNLVKRADELGCNFVSVVHPNAVLTHWIEMGKGVVITAGCILTNRIKLYDHVQINLDCTIGHDVVINRYVTLSPGVHVSGNVSIDEGVFIGTGANIVEKINIGKWSLVGAGSVIAQNVKENTTVVGVPGKQIKERHKNWHLD